MKTDYTYTLLRYVHDATSDKFANVGVVLFAPDSRCAGAVYRDTTDASAEWLNISRHSTSSV